MGMWCTISWHDHLTFSKAFIAISWHDHLTFTAEFIQISQSEKPVPGDFRELQKVLCGRWEKVHALYRPPHRIFGKKNQLSASVTAADRMTAAQTGKKD
jgi:hypothetical protein